jgi:hypothetical protein
MSELANQLKRCIWKLLDIYAEGKRDAELIRYISSLIDELDQRSEVVKVRMGKFGFCSCYVSEEVCLGCHKTIPSCVCEVLFVHPNEVVNEEYARRVKEEEIEEQKLDS